MWTLSTRSIWPSLAVGLLVLGVTNPVIASIPLTLDVSDGYTFSGVSRTTKTGAIDFFDEQLIGPFSVPPSSQHLLSWNRGEADDFLNCDPTMPVHSVSDSIVNRIDVHYSVDASTTPGNVVDAQVIIPSFENAGIGTTAPFPLSDLMVDLTITLPDGSTTTIPLFPEPPPPGIAAVYSGILATPFPLPPDSVAVDITFTGQVQPPLGAPQTIPLNCPPPNEGLTGVQAFGVTQLILQNVSAILFIEQPSPMDTDGDGVPNDVDLCPESDLSATVVVNDCNSGVENFLVPFGQGCTLADLVQEAFANGGQIGLQGLLADLEDEGIITPEDADAIAVCTEDSGNIGNTVKPTIWLVKLGEDGKTFKQDNTYDPTSGSALYVAILSQKGKFDATMIDPATVKLGDPKIEGGGKAGGAEATKTQDVDGDGEPDLVMFFTPQGLGVNKAINEDSKKLEVEGQVITDADADPPETQPFEGTASVKIKKEPKEKKPKKEKPKKK